MLPGTLVDLRRAEPPDLPLLAEWTGDMAVNGEFERFEQTSLAEIERDFEADPDERWHVVEDKDGTPVGYVAHGKVDGGCWVGCIVVPMARGRGYATEALRVLTDYLFLHLDIGRIQCEVHPENTASRRLVERVGFTFEGILRRTHVRGGAWQDAAMYSLLREEWGGPRILPSGPPEGGIVVS